ncbi:hypothetical protein M422DRAFT_52839 [Sphaerobolus stellatus SS14]|uniref:Uncharacterized protein n=1 Tax=Sphaerobolus stellatus (strain SS14) TaxID=990650 RepID=A0A0C9V4P1_SPHS4|nr:hypothetical protein M422DRAFT_52839 [Sphaerobolus stellatus SS14]
MTELTIDAFLIESSHNVDHRKVSWIRCSKLTQAADSDSRVAKRHGGAQSGMWPFASMSALRKFYPTNPSTSQASSMTSLSYAVFNLYRKLPDLNFQQPFGEKKRLHSVLSIWSGSSLESPEEWLSEESCITVGAKELRLLLQRITNRLQPTPRSTQEAYLADPESPHPNFIQLQGKERVPSEDDMDEGIYRCLEMHSSPISQKLFRLCSFPAGITGACNTLDEITRYIMGILIVPGVICREDVIDEFVDPDKNVDPRLAFALVVNQFRFSIDYTANINISWFPRALTRFATIKLVNIYM